jgi:hypothetical protein
VLAGTLSGTLEATAPPKPVVISRTARRRSYRPLRRRPARWTGHRLDPEGFVPHLSWREVRADSRCSRAHSWAQPGESGHAAFDSLGTRPPLRRARRAHALVGLITQRSSVQIRPPQPKDQGVTRHAQPLFRSAVRELSGFCGTVVRSGIVNMARPQLFSGHRWSLDVSSLGGFKLRHLHIPAVPARPAPQLG